MLDLSVYLVTDSVLARAAGHDPVHVVAEAVRGGVRCVQVRDKGASDAAVLAQLADIAAVIPEDVTLLVNDRVDVFLAARAAGIRVDGVHVGQGDERVSRVRARIGADAILGLSAATVAEIADAELAGVDYIGIGAIHETATKADAPPAIGVAGFAALVAGTRLPAVAIGGIALDDVAALREAGAAGVAVVSLIVSAPNPRLAARRIAQRWGATHPIPTVLSIAGTDPTGGAGLPADLKSISAHGGYALSVVTALVAQNTRGVRDVLVTPPAFVTAQLRAVSDDVRIDAVKLGMLADADTIAVVRDWLGEVRPRGVVLDPVMVASSGDRLLATEAESALRELVDHVDLVTPNIAELAILTEEAPAHSWPEVLAQAQRLAIRHDVTVLAKGGHLDGEDAPDALVDATTVIAVPGARVHTTNTHGTGCSLSSALATLYARTGNWEASLRTAKAWLTGALETADQLDIGTGHGPVHHLHELWRAAGLPTQPRDIAAQWWERVAPLRAQIDALDFIVALGDGTLAPERFTHYLAQDALYLRDYSRVLARAAELAPDRTEQAWWSAAASQCLTAEVALHDDWLTEHGGASAIPAASTQRYTDHLLATAGRGSYAEIVAAVLPCYWIYADLGTRLGALAHDEHPYRDWLTQYADPGFAAATRTAIAIASRAAATAGPELRAAMLRAFERSAEFERDFFEAARSEAVAG